MVHLRQKRLQVFIERSGQRCVQELPLNFSVIFAMQGEVQEVVLGYELIEHIGRQDDGWRHRDANAGKAAGDTALAQEVANEGEAASLAAKGSRSDPQKT